MSLILKRDAQTRRPCCVNFAIFIKLFRAFDCSLCENIGKLENRCEELQRLLEEARAMLEKQQQLQKRRRERRKSSQQRGFDVHDHDGIDQIESEPSSSRPTRSNSPKDSHSDTESERTGSRTQEASSGYSSSSIESHLHRLDQSDSEMSSPDREQVSLIYLFLFFDQ